MLDRLKSNEEEMGEVIYLPIETPVYMTEDDKTLRRSIMQRELWPAIERHCTCIAEYTLTSPLCTGLQRSHGNGVVIAETRQLRPMKGQVRI